DLDKRPVRDAVAVREAGTGQDDRVPGQGRLELAGAPRLADPRRPEDRHEAAPPFGDGGVERRAHPAELVAPADERGVEPPVERGRALDDAEQPEGRDVVRLALERQRLDRLDL